MKYFALLFLAFTFSCVKKIDSSELIRNNVFDQFGENVQPWFEQTGTVESHPDPNVPSNVQYVFKYKVTSNLVVENRENFEIILTRYAGDVASSTTLKPQIFKENNDFYFKVSAYNFTNPNGKFCFGFALRQIDQSTSSVDILDCWQI